MTITKDQAQMLSSLAIASRPHRAPTWDETGVMAAIAEIRNMSLAEIILRVIRAAADRDAITPGVIPRNGPHANEQLKAPRWEPTILEPDQRCGICNHERHDSKCRYCPPIDDHTFVADFKQQRPKVAAELIVADLKTRKRAYGDRPTPETTEEAS